LAGTLIATADPATLGLVDPVGGFAVVNIDQMITGDFPRQRDYDFRTKQLTARIRNALQNSLCLVDATSLSVALLGDAIGANLLLLGYAWQKGKIPISLDALHRAIEINGFAVTMSKMAFALGRKGAVDCSGLRESAYGPARATLPTIGTAY
jgi:indolepyruvate ferredoxin oxidoreductase